jgi:hypothetical protein
MIYQMPEYSKAHTKQLTGNEDVVPSDGEDEEALSGQCNDGTHL